MKNTCLSLLSATVLVSLLLSSGCKDDDDSPQDPLDLLPPATQEGKNTLGGLVNGRAWVPASTIRVTAIYQQGILQIGAGIEEPANEENISMVLHEGNLKPGSYLLNEQLTQRAIFIDLTTSCEYTSYSPSSGKLNISLIDYQEFIIAGTFEFLAVSEDCQDTVRVTDGRFDIDFIP